MRTLIKQFVGIMIIFLIMLSLVIWAGYCLEKAQKELERERDEKK